MTDQPKPEPTAVPRQPLVLPPKRRVVMQRSSQGAAILRRGASPARRWRQDAPVGGECASPSPVPTADRPSPWSGTVSRIARTGRTCRATAGSNILPGMSTRPRSQAGPPMTLGNMRANGVRSLAVSCWQCHHQAALSADRWPDACRCPTFGPSMVCSRGLALSCSAPLW